ncbi:hypothetical protein PT279_07710 [Bifidobacterium sp. ESL0784]|uniref:helix-turn-helix domain-containing protein n=1 Tax=Bifidobacterium sp. ESL0784 TaxID=2983231 RepID=UPI0023F8D7E1|nr:helix-turn-helix domain-containing protein [Bifidobacterium sp. ESL0784]MDF7641468.1 hypothetical protein [Bifidobacterium sp. ESL0784]
MTDKKQDDREPAGGYEQRVVSWNVAALLADRKLSKASLAAALGITRQSLYAKMKCSTVWTVPDLAETAEFLGTSVQSLLDDRLMRSVKASLNGQAD